MAASMDFDFRAARSDFRAALQGFLPKNALSDCIPHVQNYHGNESEKKLSLDQALRDLVRFVVQEDHGCSVYRDVINTAIDAATQDVCSASTPFVILSDVFDMITLEQCEDIFNLVEEKVSTWKSDTFYDAGKNYLLRMCNDLLRRLSKSQNTVFCGRIQLFLSRLFPLSEKSALNLMSQFNLDNVTLYNTKPEESRFKTDKMEFEDGEMEEPSGMVPIDYNLYRKFWALQDFFRKPVQCYEKLSWLTFVSNADEVLTAFNSYKLDDMKSSRKKLDKPYIPEAQTYFAKYLTSEKLLNLQLADSNFRRYVLVQFLIFIQYLNSPVKFKNANYVLTEDQNGWLKTTEEKVYQLLKETPPDGEKFSKSVQHILRREENWNSWKNEGCPSFERNKPATDVHHKRAKRKSLGADLMASGGKIIKMGNPELTRLWNLCPDNNEACKSEKRIFLPSLEDFFVDAIEQADPEAMMDEDLKLVNEQVFQWKALRLLARRSPHFFTHTHQPAVSLPVYLESMVTKLAKEMPPPHEEMKTEIGEEEEIKAPSPEEEGEEIKNDGADIPASTWKFNSDFLQGGSTDDLPITKQQISEVAEGLGNDWKKLAVELNFLDDVIAYFDSENQDLTQKALKMLTVWFENEAEQATPGCIRTALNEIGLLELADQVFPDADGNN